MEAHIGPQQPSHGGLNQTPTANLVVELDETQTRPRFIWTQQLHNKFKEAVAYLGPQKAVPSAIMRLMNVDGLTRKIVASHLQKYRLYLKRREEATAGGVVIAEFPRRSNFASHNLQLQPNCVVYPCYMPIRSATPGVALHQPQGMVVPTYYNPYMRVPIPNPWHVGQFGSSSSSNGSSLLRQPFICRAVNPNVAMGIPVRTPGGYGYGQQDVESANKNGREVKLLNLFPMKDE